MSWIVISIKIRENKEELEKKIEKELNNSETRAKIKGKTHKREIQILQVVLKEKKSKRYKLSRLLWPGTKVKGNTKLFIDGRVKEMVIRNVIEELYDKTKDENFEIEVFQGGDIKMVVPSTRPDTIRDEYIRLSKILEKIIVSFRYKHPEIKDL